MRADKRRATFGATGMTDLEIGRIGGVSILGKLTVDDDGRVATELTSIEFPADLNEVDIDAFAEGLRQFGMTIADVSRTFAALADMPTPDVPEWFEDANPWDAHTVTFGDTLERIDGTLALHEQTTGCHCRQGPDIVMSVCDQCAFQEGNTDG